VCASVRPSREKMEKLKDDPELKPILTEIATSGAAAMDRYWNDKDLMSRISQKMAELAANDPPEEQSAKKPQVRTRRGAQQCAPFRV
jgi:hypothetical protein